MLVQEATKSTSRVKVLDALAALVHSHNGNMNSSRLGGAVPMVVRLLRSSDRAEEIGAALSVAGELVAQHHLNQVFRSDAFITATG